MFSISLRGYCIFLLHSLMSDDNISYYLGNWMNNPKLVKDYNEFIKSVFIPLYNMSEHEDCIHNKDYKALLKKCEQFNPYLYSNIWETNSSIKNKLIIEILQYGGYYIYHKGMNLAIPSNELICKFRFIINLIRYTNIDFDMSKAYGLIIKYIPDTSNDEELNELIYTIDSIFEYSQ